MRARAKVVKFYYNILRAQRPQSFGKPLGFVRAVTVRDCNRLVCGVNNVIGKRLDKRVYRFFSAALLGVNRKVRGRRRVSPKHGLYVQNRARNGDYGRNSAAFFKVLHFVDCNVRVKLIFVVLNPLSARFCVFAVVAHARCVNGEQTFAERSVCAVDNENFTVGEFLFEGVSRVPRLYERAA